MLGVLKSGVRRIVLCATLAGLSVAFLDWWKDGPSHSQDTDLNDRDSTARLSLSQPQATAEASRTVRVFPNAFPTDANGAGTDSFGRQSPKDFLEAIRLAEARPDSQNVSTYLTRTSEVVARPMSLLEAVEATKSSQTRPTTSVVSPFDPFKN